MRPDIVAEVVLFLSRPDLDNACVVNKWLGALITQCCEVYPLRPVEGVVFYSTVDDFRLNICVGQNHVIQHSFGSLDEAMYSSATILRHCYVAELQYAGRLYDALNQYASDALHVVDCAKQAAALRWLTYCQQQSYCEKERRHTKTVRILNDYITTLADKLKSERDKLQKEAANAKRVEDQLSQLQAKMTKLAFTAETIAKGRVLNEDRIRQKPSKHLGEALKIQKSKLSEAAACVTPDAEATSEASSKQVNELKSEVDALNARLAEELDRLRATFKKQEKTDKKNKKKGSA